MDQVRYPQRFGFLGGLIFLLVATIIPVGGYLYYQHEQDRITWDKYQDLASISRLKADRIAQWRQERLRDAQRDAKSPLLRKIVEELVNGAGNDAAKSLLKQLLILETQTQGYTDAFILDLNGAVLLSAHENAAPLSPAAMMAVSEAVSNYSPTFSPLYKSPDGDFLLDAVAPIIDSTGSPIAVIDLRSDADSSLFPLIETWPVPSHSAETLLLTRDGPDVVFLNKLRFDPTAALSLRIPLTSEKVPAVQAALGKTGMFQGLDYRGVEVLADLRPVPNTPWFLVAKVDADEILAEARYRGKVIAIFVMIFIVLASAIVAYMFRLRQARLYRGLYRSEHKRLGIQEEFRTTLYSIGDGVITTDRNGLVKLMNPVAEQLTAVKESEARGRPLEQVFQIINENTREVVENPVQRVLREGAIVGLANHTILISSDGIERPIADSGAPIRDQDGAVIGVVLVFRDQTEERSAQEAILEAYGELKQIFDVSVPLCIIEKDFRLSRMNDSFCELFKVRREEIIGRKCHEVWDGPLCQTPDCMLTKIMDKNETCSYEFDKRLSDGSFVSVITVAKPFMDESGHLIGIIETFSDITDRKLAEEKLRESEQRYRTVADFTYDWEYWIDPEGKLQYVSPSCERITGYSAQDFLADPELMNKLVHSDQSSDVSEHFHVEARGNDYQSYNFDFRIVSRNGETRWINHICQGVSGETGQPLGRRGSNRDITDRKNLERQLLHAQKMEAVGTLAGGIAHDFNNLLQVIQGYSELILLRKQPDDEDYADLQKVYESSKRGDELVKSLLLFSRKVQPELRAVDLNHEIVEIRKLLFHTVPKTIKIELRLTGEPKTVLADPSQIGQVLMNLGVNARDAMPDGGTLAIETANVELDNFYCSIYPYLKPGTYVLLTVSDSGHGMDRKTLSRIFEPFFTTKEVGKGTGLGLATVYAIVKQHFGYIQCYSEPGQGTTFKIYLPAIQATEEPEVLPQKAPIIGGTETILMVDDDDAIRDLGASTLNHFGYQVITAANGKEALEIYQKKGGDIALILLDLMMPEMDGRRCLAEILKINPKAKVLIASGYTEPWQGSGIQANMAKGFVKKPYDIRKLLQMVRDTLDDHHLD